MQRRLQFLCLCPSVYIFKWLKRLIIPLTGIIILVALICRLKLMSSNTTTHMLVKRICSKYKDGKSEGNMCQELCQKDAPLTWHIEHDTMFTGTVMKNTSAVFKFAKISLEPLMAIDYEDHKDVIFPNEDRFSSIIQNLVISKFNISLHSIDARRISYLKYRPNKINRHVEMVDVISLLADNEYLALTLYETYNLFPKLLGSCGNLYVVQKLNTIPRFWHLLTFYDSQEEWEKRVKISLMIMDYLLVLENDVPEPIVMCNVKMNNFGLTNDFKKIMYLGLDSVHPLSVANSITRNNIICKKHSDCDYLDCRSYCNLVKEKCQYGVVNNNLQIVCEKIFLGWTMSGKVLIPGLLLGPRTPRFLVELLEKCANPSGEPGIPRAPATMEIRNRLYNFLRHLVL